jgi:LuxR family maltose regulon positive regulatory protein
MAGPLLQTKLYVPPTRSEWVSRPRLIERLNAGLSRKLTLVSAPAGFGKTTLLSEWVNAGVGSSPDDEDTFSPTPYSRLPTPSFAWLSLDEDDNDPTRFLAYVISALQAATQAAVQTVPSPSEADLGADALAMLQSHQPPPTSTVLTSLINDLAARPAKATLVLVLDDYHLVKSQPIHDALVFVLDHLPPPTGGGGVHLVVVSRQDPPLPLARLRVNGEMNEIRAGDLRFTPGEIDCFFNHSMELGLGAAEIAALDTRTEGWIAGLHLAALSLRARRSPGERSAFIEAFAGDDRHVVDYLVNQVLARQPEPVQRFLLHTAILERLSGPLCDAVRLGAAQVSELGGAKSHGGLESSAKVLEYLEQANLFVVPLDNRREWYRYHHMFADLLRFRLHRTVGTQGLKPLHIRASEWYERNGHAVEAIHHALAAGDHDRAVRLVEASARGMFVRSELATILKWVAALPVDRVHARPWLCIYTAWSKRLSGALVPEVEEWVQAAEQALEAAASTSERTASPDEERAMQGHIATLRAYQALYREQIPRAAELARRALEDLPKEDFIRGLGALALGWATRFSGDLPGASRAFAQATEASLAAGNRYVASASAARLAYTHVLEGRLHLAEVRCHESLRLAASDLARGVEGRRLPVAGYALVYLGGVHHEWDDLESAEQHLQQGIELCAQVGYPMDQIVGYATLARLRQAQGDEIGAREACQRAEGLSDRMRGYLYARRWAESCRVRLWVAQGRLDALARWVTETDLHVDDEIDFTRELAHLILVRALVALGRQAPKSGHLGDAHQLLARLLDAAEGAGWMGKAIEILALQALVCQAEGDTAQALASLRRALTLAEPEGYARVFLDEGAPMATLLREAAARGIVPSYVQRLLSSTTDDGPQTTDDGAPFVVRRPSSVARTNVGRPSSPTQSLDVDPLSARELEVLALLSDGLTNQEIATRLFLAVSTVKVHTRNLYSKLDVHSRIQAVTRAHELGLLS